MHKKHHNGLAMHPFFHPTTVLIVDDDQLLIKTMETWLQAHRTPFVSFQNPKDALLYAHTQEQKHPVEKHFFSAYPDVANITELQRGDLLIKLETSNFFHLLENPERFSQVSVAIIDYDMPGMTGLEMCRALKDLPIKKIMLTGRASQNQAINAFNERIIDCFLSKHDPELENKLRAEIEQLQRAFFSENTETLKLACSLQETEFITDPVFQKIFLTSSNKHNVVEYYLNTHPPGLLMFTATGQPIMLLVYDQQRLRAHYEIAQEANAPQGLLHKLQSEQILPLFPTKSGYYEKYVKDNWQNYLWSAQKLNGHKDWYISFLINEDFLNYGLDKFASFENYTKNLH